MRIGLGEIKSVLNGINEISFCEGHEDVHLLKLGYVTFVVLDCQEVLDHTENLGVDVPNYCS